MIISFAWTSKQFLAGTKTCTRRDWNEKYFQQWVRAYRAGKLIHDGYDRLPRAGGHKIGEFKLTCEPYRERLADMPESDLIAEGNLWRDKQEFIDLQGGDPEKVLAVVRLVLIPPQDRLL